MKILIIGSVASGKTTLARRISKEINIKHYEIDSIVHDDKNNKKRSTEEQKEIIDRINKNNNWIIEGTLRNNLYLLDYADKIIYINTPLKVRKRRIIIRFIKQKLGIEQSNYKPTLKLLKDMFKWINQFEKERKQFEEKLSLYKDKVCYNNEIKDKKYIL